MTLSRLKKGVGGSKTGNKKTDFEATAAFQTNVSVFPFPQAFPECGRKDGTHFLGSWPHPADVHGVLGAWGWGGFTWFIWC